MPGYHDPNRDLLDRVARLEARVSELSRSTGQTITAVRDKEENIVFATDAVGGLGIARPWIPFTMHALNNNTFPRTSAGASAHTPQALWYGEVMKQHPAMMLNIGLWPVGEGTYGFARIEVNGVKAWPDIESLGTNVIRYVTVGPIALPGAYLDKVGVKIFGWVRSDATAATRAMSLMVRSAYSTELENPEDTGSTDPV